MDSKGNLIKKIYEEIIIKQIDSHVSMEKLTEILKNYYVHEFAGNPELYEIETNIDNFLKEKALTVGKMTVNSYRHQLNILKNYTNKKVNDITKNDIIDFLQYRKENHKVKKSTIALDRSVLLVFFDWLEDKKLVVENPMNEIAADKEEGILVTLDIEELSLIRNNCSTLREKAIVEMLYSTGCKLNEMVTATLDDIDWDNKRINIKSDEKKRFVFFSEEAMNSYKIYLGERDDDSKALFVTERKPYRGIGARTIEREINRISKRTGIDKQISPNILRNTFTKIMLKNGCPNQILQEFLGNEGYNTSIEALSKIRCEDPKAAYAKYLY
ncbi:tyrosine-type recombinase/integrase [Clostridium estertheticum]|uniref:Tyrosine-type recombinase/integrase n=1 Tax=Clostridium estertheticum TaxID=238834 RepID=A0A7Y3WSW5_9CLOT|nr:tyrosine-type recombinase/integrase [Clostridium estertheticum]NNU76546.1 tyrosine-type recombinase/integrase [Clostridium estertheticum]WBL49692.1 tyrosine-type recombinase/integrase [Clostridium estertheticum]